LYSTYEDAKSGSNAWQFCNSSNSKGFPSECGPTGYVANQHSRFNNNSGQSHVVFLVEKGGGTSMNPITGNLISGDIGGVKISGTARTLSNERYYVTNAGDDIWGRNDEFNFVREEASGDLIVKVLVNSLIRTHDWAKAGLMIRQDASQNSVNFACVAPAKRKPFATFRTSKGANTYYAGNPRWINEFTPVWLKLTKQDKTFQCLSSTDGENWTILGTRWMQFNSNSYLVGMAVTSHDDDVMTDAMFQHYSMATANGDQNGNNSNSGALDNYEFYPRRDSNGNDLRRIGGNIEDYAEWCNRQPACKGFNSNGWMKHTIRPQNQWSWWTSDPNKGFYVKV